MGKSDLQKDYEERKWKAKETSANKSRVPIITIISLIISVGAFLLSSFVTILGSFRIKDDIRIVERGLPIVRHEPGSHDNLQIVAPKQWVITNAGNRAAAIAGAFVFFLKNSEQNDDCDKSILDNANVLGLATLNLEPFVIEPRKVEIKSIKIKEFDWAEPTDSILIAVPIEKWGPQSVQGVKLCLSVQVITPDQYSIVSELISRADWNWDEPQTVPDVGKLPTISRQEPWILISESKWGFFDKRD